jgi:hypothetical protein
MLAIGLHGENGVDCSRPEAHKNLAAPVSDRVTQRRESRQVYMPCRDIGLRIETLEHAASILSGRTLTSLRGTET